jgi:ribosome-associated translation inhibitor RaiA
LASAIDPPQNHGQWNLYDEKTVSDSDLIVAGEAGPAREGQMQTPVDIAFRQCEPSEEIRSEIAAQAQRLEKFSPRITSCHVVVNGPQTRHQNGDLFNIRLCIAMPGHKDVVVDRRRGDAPEREHLRVAVREAFDAAVRQIEEAQREMRGRVKQHPVEDTAASRSFSRTATAASSKRPRAGKSIFTAMAPSTA